MITELIRLVGPALASLLVAVIHRWMSKRKIKELVRDHLVQAGVPADVIDQVTTIIKNEACNGKDKEK